MLMFCLSICVKGVAQKNMLYVCANAILGSLGSSAMVDSEP